MKFQVLDKDETTVLHELETIPEPQMGAVYSLCVMLYCLSSKYRDAMISYIISRGDLDIDAMAKCCGCAPSTIATRLNIARKVFTEAVRDYGGAFPVREDLAILADDGTTETAETAETTENDENEPIAKPRGRSQATPRGVTTPPRQGSSQTTSRPEARAARSPRPIGSGGDGEATD